MKKVLIFTAGLAIGMGVSWQYHKNKYEKLANEDMLSVRKYMNKKYKDTESSIVETVEDEDDANKEKVDRIINVCNYSSNDKPIYDAKDRKEKPFVISPDEFAGIMDFDSATFYYTSDNKITNDNGDLIEDVEQLFGLSTPEIRAQFGVYDEDVVYFRDLKLKIDYELLYEEQEYRSRN